MASTGRMLRELFDKAGAMEPYILDAAHLELLAILQTTYAYAHTQYMRVLDLIYRHDGQERLTLMADLLLWARLIPDNTELVDESAIATPQEVDLAVELLNSLLHGGALPLATEIELGNTPPQAAIQVLKRLDALAEHGRIVQAVWLSNIILQHPDFPFLKHLAPYEGEQTSSNDVSIAVARRPDLVVQMEHAIRNAKEGLHELATWLGSLTVDVCDPATRYAFIRYAMLRMVATGRRMGSVDMQNVHIISSPGDFPEVLQQLVGKILPPENKGEPDIPDPDTTPIDDKKKAN